MLLVPIMKTTLGLVFGSLLFTSAALADAPGPDFVGGTQRPHIDRSLVASNGPHNKIEPGDVIAFKLNKATMTDAGFDQVDRAAYWIKSHPKHRIVLEGHTDKVGTAAYNEDLATRRIAAVRDRLMTLGVGSDRIIMMTFGENEAISPENPNDRRVVLYATKLSPKAIAAASFEDREAAVATWTDNGSMKRIVKGMPETNTTPTRQARRGGGARR